MTNRLVSIGYEHRTLDQLIDALRDAHVGTVADVRLTPMSRKPGMSKKRISEAAEAAGIGYLHAKALGNPKDNRDAYHRGDPAAIERYRQVLEGEAGVAAVVDIARLLQEHSVALLCLEADPARCHRTLVARAVRRRRRGVPLVEL